MLYETGQVGRARPCRAWWAAVRSWAFSPGRWAAIAGSKHQDGAKPGLEARRGLGRGNQTRDGGGVGGVPGPGQGPQGARQKCTRKRYLRGRDEGVWNAGGGEIGRQEQGPVSLSQ